MYSFVKSLLYLPNYTARISFKLIWNQIIKNSISLEIKRTYLYHYYTVADVLFIMVKNKSYLKRWTVEC